MTKVGSHSVEGKHCRHQAGNEQQRARHVHGAASGGRRPQRHLLLLVTGGLSGLGVLGLCSLLSSRRRRRGRVMPFLKVLLAVHLGQLLTHRGQLVDKFSDLVVGLLKLAISVQPAIVLGSLELTAFLLQLLQLLVDLLSHHLGLRHLDHLGRHGNLIVNALSTFVTTANSQGAACAGNGAAGIEELILPAVAGARRTRLGNAGHELHRGAALTHVRVMALALRGCMQQEVRRVLVPSGHRGAVARRMRSAKVRPRGLGREAFVNFLRDVLLEVPVDGFWHRASEGLCDDATGGGHLGGRTDLHLRGRVDLHGGRHVPG
mmetsp:Transcript_6798/g.17336  ORF Transcript_6798/g.17336 Transcript_6798/m.17336 type:complete len:319 (+) Transcript_6798:167-1123(+)